MTNPKNWITLSSKTHKRYKYDLYTLLKPGLVAGVHRISIDVVNLKNQTFVFGTKHTKEIVLLEGAVTQSFYKDGKELLKIQCPEGALIEVVDEDIEVQTNPKETSYLISLSEHPEEYDPSLIPTDEDNDEKSRILQTSKLALGHIKIGV